METTQAQGWLHQNLQEHVCELHATYMSLVFLLTTSFGPRGRTDVRPSLSPEKGTREGRGPEAAPHRFTR